VPGARQTFVDYRFQAPSQDLDAIIYNSTNGYIEPTNSPTLQRIFRETLRGIPPAKPITKQGARALFLGAFIITSAVPLALLRFKAKPMKGRGDHERTQTHAAD
jgi:hypothetical protein